jgi:hypothetical protein
MNAGRGRYRTIEVELQADEGYLGLSRPGPSGQGLWEYLLRCGHDRSVPGLLVVGLGQLSDELGWAVDDVRRVWAEIEALGMARADWGARVVWIPKAVARASRAPRNRKTIAGWGRYWGEVPECSLKLEAHDEIVEALRALAPTPTMPAKAEDFVEVFLGACPRPALRGWRKVAALPAPAPEVAPEVPAAAREPEPPAAVLAGPVPAPAITLPTVTMPAPREPARAPTTPRLVAVPAQKTSGVPHAAPPLPEEYATGHVEGERVGDTAPELDAVRVAWNEHRGPLAECERLYRHETRTIVQMKQRYPERRALAWWVDLTKRAAAAKFLATKEGGPPSLAWFLESKGEERISKLFRGEFDAVRAPARRTGDPRADSVDRTAEAQRRLREQQAEALRREREGVRPVGNTLSRAELPEALRKVLSRREPEGAGVGPGEGGG